MCAETIIEELINNVAIRLCMVEKEFPPSFIVFMTHLVIHFVEDLELSSLFLTRWMYPIEWYLKTLKAYVCNQVRPEASMTDATVV